VNHFCYFYFTSNTFASPSLQRLFGHLALTPRAAVTSIGLTTSFGWEGEEAFVQHDAQELMRVLFEALQLSDTCFDDDGTSFSSFLPHLFSGVCANILKCSQCGHKSEREDIFYDICLPVQGMNVTMPSTPDATSLVVSETSNLTPLTSLHRSIRSFLYEESLTGADQWSCSGKCNGSKVDATKSFTLTKLPPVMTIHLKRFSYDASTGKYAKVNDPFSFPLVIDFDGFLVDAKEKVLSHASNVATSKSLPIFSIVPPLPSTGGSARSAVHALRARRESLEADALAALCRGDVLSEEEEEAIELMEAMERDEKGAKEAKSSTKDEISPMSSSVPAQSLLPLSDSHTHAPYELYSILMHSGVTSRGHYFAFIRSPDSSTSSWLLMNDATILPLTEAEVLTASGALSGLSSEFISPPSIIETVSGNAKSIPPGGSPYMLLYRRKDVGIEKVNSSPLLPISESIREAINDEDLLSYSKTMGCNYLDESELTALLNECKSFNALKNCHQVRQLLCEMRVRLPKLVLPRDVETNVIREASQLMQSSSTETATIYRLPFFEDENGQPDYSSVFVPLSSSIDSATTACYSLLIEAHSSKSEFKKRNCLIEFPKLSDIRLRKFDALSNKKTDSYSHATAPLTPFEAEWGLSVDVAIEIRAPVDAIQLPWPEYDPESVSIRVLKWSESSLIQDMIQRLSSFAEGSVTVGVDDSSSLSHSIPLDGRNAAMIELSRGSDGSQATVMTLLTALVDSILDPTISGSSTIPKRIHAIVIPGGLPTPSDISHGIAAGRLRQRASPLSNSNGSSVGYAQTCGLRVITIPISGDDVETVNENGVSILNLELKKDFNLCDGDDLVILQDKDDDVEGVELERALPKIKSLFSSSTIRVTFSTMINSLSSIDDIGHTLTLTARRDETLLSLKRRMIEAINISSSSSPPNITIQETHLKRNFKAPMLRDENKTLRECDIGDGTMLYLCQGAVLIDDTTQVRVLLHSSKQQVICSLLLKLSSRISTLKKEIFNSLSSLSSQTPPISASHIRLRGRQTTAGTSTSTILRDEAILRQALGVTTSYAGGDDERDVFVEFLSKPESFSKDDLLVRVTEFVKAKEGVSGLSHLTRIIDLVIPKASTLSSLSLLLTGDDSTASSIRMAKHSAYGPALNTWEAENKIKFISVSSVENSLVCDPPLSLRDGCTLIWRRDCDVVEEGKNSSVSVVDDTRLITEENKENGSQIKKSSTSVQKPWLVKKAKIDDSKVTQSTPAAAGGISIRVKQLE
jgi:hypothetical protein